MKSKGQLQQKIMRKVLFVNSKKVQLGAKLLQYKDKISVVVFRLTYAMIASV